MIAIAGLVLGTAGCSSGGAGSAAASDAPSGQSSSSSEPAPQASTDPAVPAQPVVVEGPCPYLEEAYVEETVGDRMDRVETVTVEGQPAPDCVFYLPNSSAGVSVDLTPYGDPVAAQNAALAAVTAAAQPVTDFGDYGGVIVSTGMTVLAVTSGPLLMVVTTNRESSLQAREIASTALAAIPVT